MILDKCRLFVWDDGGSYGTPEERSVANALNFFLKPRLGCEQLVIMLHDG